MELGQIRDYLLPGAAERDEEFRQEILTLSHLGLRVIGGVEIVMPLLLLGAHFFVMPEMGQTHWIAGRALTLMALGVITSLIARTDWSRRRARLLGLLSGWLVGAVMVSTSLLMTSRISWADRYIPGFVVTVMLVGVVAIPLRPMQTLSLGLSIEGFYLLCSLAVRHWKLAPGAPLDAFQHAMVVVTTLLCTALTALIYAQRTAEHRSHHAALRTHEELSQARSRAAWAESAASLGRLVAALSHELNTPVGALTSAVDTILVLSGRQATAPPSESQRLVALQADLRRSVSNSAGRLKVIIARMQRLTNLDKAEIQSIDLNELIKDLATLLEPPARGSVEWEFDLHPLPALTCRPQQLAAVFSNLLSNALNAIDHGGHIAISTRHKDSQLEVRIEDNGRGIPAEQLGAMFDPGFRVSPNRISPGNWSLFSCRQIVLEHGGDIHITSEEGNGATVSVTLPVEHVVW